MYLLFIPAALYVCISLILPLRLSWILKIILMSLLMLGALRAQLLHYFWPGGESFLPEAPRSLLIASSALYTAVLVFSQLTLLRDLLCWPVVLLRKMLRGGALRFPFQSTGLLVVLLGISLTTICMWQSMRVPEPRSVEVEMPSLPKQYDGLRLVFLADIHLSPINDANYARAIVARVNALDPDLVVIVGDIADGEVEHRRKDLAPLADLKARYGVYATAGNHEYYSGYAECMQAYRALGMKTLENENAQPLAGLSLIGVCDYTGYPSSHPRSAQEPGVQLAKARRGVPARDATILLAHQPAVAEREDVRGIDLLLSGHSHGGMMAGPLSWFTHYASAGFTRGRYHVGETIFYVTTGAGTWPGAMFRLNVPSEIMLMQLRSRRDMN